MFWFLDHFVVFRLSSKYSEKANYGISSIYWLITISFNKSPKLIKLKESQFACKFLHEIVELEIL
jgi:hypothetical protein